MNKKNIFVTGADGFIGSHLCEALVNKGHNVSALTQYNSFNSWGWLDDIPKKILKEINVLSGDIRDSHGISNYVKNKDIVIHLAALIAIPFSYTSPNTYIETNVNGTLNLLQACRSSGIEKFIHTSTSEVYGTAKYVPINEEHPLVAQSPYAASKIAADQIAYSFYSSFDLPVSIIRPFNTYGPRQSARAVIPTIISQILNGNKIIKLGSVNPTRDFNYVRDTVSGFISCTKNKKGIGEVINIGNNYEISIKDLVKLIASLLNKKVDIRSDNMRIRPKNSEVDRLRADNSKAKKILKWAPKYYAKNGLKKGLMETIDWITKGNNLSRYKSEVYNI